MSEPKTWADVGESIARAAQRLRDLEAEIATLRTQVETLTRERDEARGELQHALEGGRSLFARFESAEAKLAALVALVRAAIHDAEAHAKRMDSTRYLEIVEPLRDWLEANKGEPKGGE